MQRNPSSKSRLVRHEPAATIIKLLGGRIPVARLVGLDEASVSKWSMGGKHGYRGRIPPKYHDALLSHARALGVPINRINFLPLSLQHADLSGVLVRQADGSSVAVSATAVPDLYGQNDVNATNS